MAAEQGADSWPGRSDCSLEEPVMGILSTFNVALRNGVNASHVHSQGNSGSTQPAIRSS